MSHSDGTLLDAGSNGNAPAPSGIIYDIQGFSVQDGPGIRTTVFLKGCPLRCPWCHSPESQRFEPQLSWQWRKCIGLEECGLCLDCCPRGAISPAAEPVSGPAAAAPAAAPPTGAAAPAAAAPVPLEVSLELTTESPGDVRLVEIDWDKCDDCGLCAERCPAGALSMWGKRYEVAEVVDRVARDLPFFEKSGGGVTVSGGEPLSQRAFTAALLQALKERGIHTALDTTGYASWEAVEAVLPYVDLFLLDLKAMDAADHRRVVGVPNERILENARRIAAAGGKIQVRVPVIPRFNDSEDDFRILGAFVAGLGEAVSVVQLLPYHAMGVPKWERIKREGPVLEASAPPDEKIQVLKEILEEYGLNVTVH